MSPDDLVQELSNHIVPALVSDLVESFMELRKDCKTGTLGRSSAGKFVETVVQVLQYFENGTYDQRPKVDAYLNGLESRESALPDDLKICCSRIARSSYGLRNKRNIAHKGSVDPNIYDLNYTYAAAQWMLSEIVRYAMNIEMAAAGAIIEFIQIPIFSIVERFGDRKLVCAKLTIENELLVLLHSYYPGHINSKVIQQSMDPRSKSGVSNALSKLWQTKLVHRDKDGYILTQLGFNRSVEILAELAAGN